VWQIILQKYGILRLCFATCNHAGIGSDIGVAKFETFASCVNVTGKKNSIPPSRIVCPNRCKDLKMIDSAEIRNRRIYTA
jgi:hypothetical protein